MKRLLLIADSTYAARDTHGELYFRGSFSAKTWERYLGIADNINFICREDKKVYSEKEAKEQLQKSPSSNIEVSFIKNRRASVLSFVNPKIKKENEKILKNAISDSDGIIIRTLGSVSASFMIKTIKKANKKYMYECVGNAWDALWNYGIKGKILAPGAYLIEKKLAANADAVLYVTEKYLQSWYPTKAPQAGISDVDIPVADSSVLVNRLKKIEGELPKIVLGTAGTVEVAYKGQEYVIKAISELERRGIQNIEYQLAGNGDNTRLKQISVDEGVEEKVQFLGTLSHEGVISWLDKIDLYIQPSMLEGMPRALIEAMSRGLPCMGSNVGGIPELLTGKTMFKKKCVKEIADCIERMTKERMKEQAERNFKFSQKFYPKEKDEHRKDFYGLFEKQCIQGAVDNERI